METLGKPSLFYGLLLRSWGCGGAGGVWVGVARVCETRV